VNDWEKFENCLLIVIMPPFLGEFAYVVFGELCLFAKGLCYFYIFYIGRPKKSLLITFWFEAICWLDSGYWLPILVSVFSELQASCSSINSAKSSSGFMFDSTLVNAFWCYYRGVIEFWNET